MVTSNTKLEIAREKSRIRRAKTRCRPINKPIDDCRNLCRATRADGYPCAYRAKNQLGYCMRHDKEHKYTKLSALKRNEWHEETASNEEALACVKRRQLPQLPPCPNCRHLEMQIDDKKIFGRTFAMCANIECCKRIDVRWIAKWIVDGETQESWLTICNTIMKPKKKTPDQPVKKEI